MSDFNNKDKSGAFSPFVQRHMHDSGSKAPLVIFMWQCDPTKDDLI
jgi:hypothetical protein